MATYINNQPIFLGTEDACLNNDFVYNQIVDNNDLSQFQLKLEPCVGTKINMGLVEDPEFNNSELWYQGDGVTISSQTACWQGDTIEGIGGSVLAPTNLTLMDDGKYYMFVIVVTSISGGGLIVSLGQNVIGTIYTVGTHTLWGYCIADYTFTGLVIYPDTDGVNACLSYVNVYEVETNFIIPFYDLDGNFITQISYNAEPSYFNFFEDSVTILIDWATLGLQNGCYYFCVLDPCLNTNGQNYQASIVNPRLDYNEECLCTFGWIHGKFEWTSNLHSVTGTYLGYGECFGQENVFPTYDNYGITIEVVNGSSINLDVYFGDTLVGNISSVGTFTFYGTPTTDLNLYICIEGGTAEITSVNPITNPEDYVCDMTSNTFKVGDYANDCTILVQACNNEDGLGFNFGSYYGTTINPNPQPQSQPNIKCFNNFIPSVRLDAKLINPKYQNDRSTYTDSKGKKSVYYFQGRKQKYFVTDLQPEYILDFLWLLFGYDNVYLNGLKYSVDDDEFSPEYAFDSIGKVKFLVSIKEQDIKNTNCSSLENECVRCRDENKEPIKNEIGNNNNVINIK